MENPCCETVLFGQLGCRYEDNSNLPYWPHLRKTESQVTDPL